MRRLAIASLCTLSLAPTPAQVAPALAHRDVAVVELSGTPRERGITHGRQLGEEIRETLDLVYRDIERAHEVDRKTFVERFLGMTDFVTAIERWTPGVLEEVRGIAEGAGLPFEDVFVLQLIDEVWSMGKWAARDKCTAVAVARRGDRPTMVAQTIDLPRFLHRYPTVLRVRRDGGPDALIMTIPGAVGANGVNSDAVAVCCNTLLQLRPSPTGLPCLFVVRGILQHRSLAGAEAWLREIPHACGQNYTIGDRTGARAFECSAGDVVQYSPGPEADFTYHTNHPLVSRDWHRAYLERCRTRELEPEAGLPDCKRLASLRERIRPGLPITAETLVETLASRDHGNGSICGDWNYCGTVYVLGEVPEMHLVPGRADRYAMQQFGF